MSNKPRLQPIWTPNDAKQAAADAATHRAFPAVKVTGIRPRRLRLLLAAAALGALTVAVAVGTAVDARADSGALIDWAAIYGFTDSDSAVVVRGALVCADVAGGDSGEEAARDLWLNSGIVDLDDARAFVVAAVDNMCPQFDRRNGAGVA